MNYLGKRVRSHISVFERRVPTHIGIVTRDDGSGSCLVDRMSLHGGAPWEVWEAKSDLDLIDDSTSPITSRNNSLSLLRKPR